MQKFIEQSPSGRGLGRSAYAFEAAILTAPAAGMKWHAVADFSAAEEVLRNPGLKTVFKAAFDTGFAVLAGPKISCAAALLDNQSFADLKPKKASARGLC
ncbi:hypothetical protein [Bradyrhizobium pachyrhizi]|uniref:hypothetical protein n=1 Tax=Bradyrhizobium pachyrhizi TaxID=280333 RepID=UPI003D365D69